MSQLEICDLDVPKNYKNDCFVIETKTKQIFD